ncbi:MAG: DnaJ domain-containing protein [Cyanobacteria bacterium J06606_4]
MAFFSGDYYRRLCLPRNASQREIKAAFRRLARLHHPDLHPNQPDAAAKFQALREAYEVLTDRVRRQRYDEAQAAGRSSESPRADSDWQSPKGRSHAARKARSSGEKCPPERPRTATDYYIRGIRFALAHRYRAAVSDYTQAIALDAQFAEAYLRRAEVLYMLEDDTGVLENCQQAIALNSTEAQTYYFQGMSRYRLGYVQSAIAAFTNAIACDPEEARFFYRRGIAYSDLSDIEAAAKDLRRAACLYRKQGDMVTYHQLQALLKPLGTAGLAWPFRAVGQVTGRLTRLLTPRRDRMSYSQQFAAYRGSTARSTTTDPVTGFSRDGRTYQMRTPSGSFGASQLPRDYAPGISSRPTTPPRLRKHRAAGFVTTFKLLSNPAGELVPIYHQLVSTKQISMMGYGLAVLANLCFVLGATQYFEESTWLAASRFWAAGGLMFVAMVFVVALVRLCLRIRGLWSADIFILGSASIPLGFLAIAAAMIPQASELAVQQLSALGDWQLAPQLVARVNLAGIAIATLWAGSHAVMTLRSGFSRIQFFSDRLAAWFSPVVLGLGIAAGLGTWEFLSAVAGQSAGL